MGRTVLGEEKILPELVRLGKTDGYIPGLIIGQSSGQKDFIVHLAKTPLPAEKANKLGNDVSGDYRKIQKKSIEELNSIQESWLIDHAKQVTRMLPGGVWVLGVFVTGPGDVFSSAAQTKIGSLLRALSKALDQNPNVCANSPSSEKLALHLVSGTNKFVCRSYDVCSSASQFRSVDCQFSALRWLTLDSQLDCDLLPTHIVTEQTADRALRQHLQEILNMIIEGVQKSLCTIDGEVRNDEDLLEVAKTGKQSKADKKAYENKEYQVNLYIPSERDNAGLDVSSVVGEMRCTGVLASRVYLHHRATVAEACKAVKEDIIRSFASRIEMHCDSLVEEEVGSPEEVMVVHEPPRRVLIPLPHSRVALSDYLFPGEGPSEALVSILDLIGVKVSETAVYKDFEGQPDQSDLYLLTANAEPTGCATDNSVSTSSHSLLLLSGIALAFLVLIASLFIQFYLK